ncbi:hypothetical protein C8F04DRAFT_1078710 [Mycena alexandri]|uniref:Uncharacterized protein n=1 Tax=Mycena alexandri TaxID=1745969 RepID=A0AAD6T9D1_9AGAR|nr:hypothetical protein C8F04DRAFT_1078710 [Mycena alexandri]
MGSANSTLDSSPVSDSFPQAHAGPTFYADNAKALEIKETANVHFRAKDYQKALDLYTSIINQYDDRIMLETIAIARCNRAACYLNLEQYQNCIDDCNITLLFVSSNPNVATKAEFRLAKATRALDDIDAQKKAVDPSYPGRPKYDIAERMREQMRQSSANSAKFRNTDAEEHRPFGYVVRMKGHNPEYVHMRDMVPASLTLGAPRGGEAAYETRREAFVKRIVLSHEPELMQKHPWTCFNCGKAATAWIHSPVSDLASFYPIIKDYARPICEREGSCATITRTAMEKAETEDSEIAREDGVRIKM